MTNRSLDELVALLAQQQRVWVRTAAIRPGTVWQLALLEVTTGEPPTSWRRHRWEYERAVFIAYAPAGSTVARWLAKERLALPSLALKVSLAESVDVERRYSNSEGLYEPLSWPADEWRVSPNDNSTQYLHGELVAGDAPAFSGFDAAAGAFFGVRPVPNRNFSRCELVVRRQDQRARIEHVGIHSAEIVVGVSGRHLANVTLSLTGIDGPSRSLTARTKTVRLPLSEGLGSGSLLVLHQDQNLLDRRILDPAWRSDDVNVEVDASTRVLALISGGERAVVEFKRQLPGNDAKAAMKTVAAFANGGGGTLLFGIDNDGQVVGLAEACIGTASIG